MSFRIVQKSVKTCQLQVTSCLSPPVEVIFSKKLFQETFFCMHTIVLRTGFHFFAALQESDNKKTKSKNDQGVCQIEYKSWYQC